jgi:hypothetical protein
VYWGATVRRTSQKAPSMHSSGGEGHNEGPEPSSRRPRPHDRYRYAGHGGSCNRPSGYRAPRPPESCMVAPPEIPPNGSARRGQDPGEAPILRGVIAARSQGMYTLVSSSIGPGQSEGPGPDEEDVTVRTRPERRREAGPRGEERPFPDLRGALYGKSGPARIGRKYGKSTVPRRAAGKGKPGRRRRG